MYPRLTAAAYVLLILFLSLNRTVAKAQVSCVPIFTKEYNSGDKIEPAAIKNLPDGSMLVAGRGTSNLGDLYDGMVMKLSGTGAIIWSFRIGGPGNDAFTGFEPLNDGGFMLFGVTASFGHPEGKAWLVRIDASGNLLWSMQMGSELAGTDRIKAVKQFTDGDLIGTMNVNDSSSASDPVIFKLGLDGTLRWAQRFDNGDNDSFTSLAFAGNTVYAAGFYTSVPLAARRGVIVELNVADGSLISSKNIYRDPTFQEEVSGLEVYNNSISYGLWVFKYIPPSIDFAQNGIVMVRKDLSGNLQFSVYADDAGGASMIMIPKRTPDNGFLLLRGNPTSEPTSVSRINPYGLFSWGVTPQQFYIHQVNTALDVTADGGCVSVGSYSVSYPAPQTTMNLIRMNSAGETGGCAPGGIGLLTDTLACWEQPFAWSSLSSFTPAVSGIVMPVSGPFASSINNLCSSSICIDKTPLPPGCDKTYRIEYSADKPSVFRDVVPTSDGGKVAVGDITQDGLVVKFGINGDVVWSRRYEEFFHNLILMRVLRTSDDNLLVLGSNYYTVNHGASRSVRMAKLDNNGNILWTKDLSRPYYSYEQEIADVVQTPDGGFIIVINDGYGTGGIYSYVIRYDASGNVIWQKQLTHSAAVPLYRSITCTGDAVFLAYDSYDYYNYPNFGVDRLDLATGNLAWDNRYSASNIVMERINRIVAINDTVYLFLNNLATASYPSNVQNTAMVQLDPQGNILNSHTLQADNVVLPNTYYQWDVSPPSVTLTPNYDFVLTNQVIVGTDTALNVSRFKRDGTPLWSKNFISTRNYSPLNIHPQASGFLIAGTATTSHAGYGSFTNCFLLKVDSIGEVIPGATGDCAQTNRTFTVGPFPISIIRPGTDGSPDLTQLITGPVNLTAQDVYMDATPFCSVLGNCGNVSFKQRGNGCSLKDTLVYFLEDASNCDAAATWLFDPSFFRPGVINGDSIELIPLQRGVSTVNATIEGNCSFVVKNISASIGHGVDQLDLGKDTIVCKGGDVRLSAGPGFASYLWNNNSTDSFLLVSLPGKYFVNVTDNCGDAGSDTIRVNLADSFFHLKGDTLSCNQAVATLQATDGYINYSWSPSYDIVAQGNVAKVNPAVTTVYQVSADRWPGCTVTAVLQVLALNSPAIYLGTDTSLCTGDSLFLNAGNLFSHYLWNTGDTVSDIYAKSVGTYTVTAAYPNGCKSVDSIKVLSLYQDPVPALNPNPVLCVGTERVLDPGVFSSYLWNDGSSFETLVARDLGKYWVLVHDQHGCKGSDTVVISRFGLSPSGFLPPDTSICQYGKLTLASLTPFDGYKWSDLSSASTLTVSQPGLYWLEVTDSNGCVGRDSIVLTGKQCIVGLYVPSAFTPNGDGHNDRFRPLLYGNVASMEFEVFDRWGGRVFETRVPMDGWDGRINGQDAAAGTYVWYCKYQLEGEKVNFAKGVVILVR